MLLFSNNYFSELRRGRGAGTFNDLHDCYFGLFWISGSLSLLRWKDEAEVRGQVGWVIGVLIFGC